MKCRVALTLIVVCLAGCHAPTPSFDLLAPYGSSRVPPPSTGSHGTGGAYYNRTAPATSVPGVSSGSTDPATSRKMQTNVSGSNRFLASDDSWKPIRTNATPEAAPVFRGATDDTASRILPVSYNGAAKGGTALQLNGMPVNDATRRMSSSEPARFRAPGDAIEITQLTRATGSSGQDATGTVVSSAKSSDRIQSASSESSTSKTTLKWGSRSP